LRLPLVPLAGGDGMQRSTAASTPDTGQPDNAEDDQRQHQQRQDDKHNVTSHAAPQFDLSM